MRYENVSQRFIMIVPASRRAAAEGGPCVYAVSGVRSFTRSYYPSSSRCGLAPPQPPCTCHASTKRTKSAGSGYSAWNRTKELTVCVWRLLTESVPVGRRDIDKVFV